MSKINRRSFLELAGASAALFPGTLRAYPATVSAPVEENQSSLPPINTSKPWIASPFDVENKAQLFVDQVLVRETEGAIFTLHPAQKHPGNPLIKADRPWESWRIELYGSVLYDPDEKIFKMWYQGETSPCFPNYVACYATSHDGVHWDKPLVSTAACATGQKTNAVLAECILPGVIRDPGDPDPARRYKMICWIEKKPSEGGGYRTFISPDGLRWTALSQAPITRGGDVITGYFDPERRIFVVFSKIATPIRGHDRRVFYLNTSTDFNHWTSPELILTPDLRDDAGSLGRIARYQSLLSVPNNYDLMRTEFYGMGAYRHESCTLGFPWVFTVNNNSRYGDNQDGLFEIQLGVSRDLKNWHRPFRVSCVHNGPLGDWDCGLITTPSEALRVGDEIWLYYGGANYTHGTPALYLKNGGKGTKYTGSIGLAKWKLDRFVSIDCPEAGGSMTTVPIIFSGNHLEINADVKPGGSITIHVLDAAGKPIDGWQPARPLHGDNLRHKVLWPEGMKLASLKGRPITLHFEMKDSDLYSFAFRD